MARKKRSAKRKRRTREHIIADLSVNFAERQALLCGHSVERTMHDYGIDLRLYTYDSNGEVENGEIQMQLKATDNLVLVDQGLSIAFRIESADLETWLCEPMPVILIVYDAQNDKAYWLYVQAYFEGQVGFDAQNKPNQITVHLPVTHVVDQEAIKSFVRFRDRVLTQIRGHIVHHA